MRTANSLYNICLIMFLWLVMIESSTAQVIQNKTTWRAINKGMDELLNSGWQMVGHSTSRVIIFPGSVNAKDEDTFTYILSKDKKIIQCTIYNPLLENTYSRCRQLN
jgi:hypothetical protein